MFRFVQWIKEGRPVHLNGDGSQSRGFTFVDDIARGTILGLRPLGYEIINLGGHEVITMNEMISSLETMPMANPSPGARLRAGYWQPTSSTMAGPIRLAGPAG